MIIYTTRKAIATKYSKSLFIINKRYKLGFIRKVVDQNGNGVGYIFVKELIS